MKSGDICSSETVTGGENVFSSEPSDVSSADHLVVMVNGILGSSEDWRFAAEQFVKSLPDRVFVHRSEKNAASQTLDGVDVMGERLSQEVLEVIKQKPNLRKISFVAHSVGGLVARYAIGRLYRPPREKTEEMSAESFEEEKATIGGLVPMNFITVATPHLGSRGHKQVPFLFGVSALEKVAVLVIHWIFRRTGRHLFLTDDDEGKPPLLKRMLEDSGDCYFMSALRSFHRRVAYANVGYDRILWTLLWEDSVNEKYPHVVYEERCKACDLEQDLTKDDNTNDVEEELVTGLSRVSWEKVDVSFHNSRSRFAAHSVIQVKNCNLHTDGVDVIQHMIDHFSL
ncbi:alpha/beta-Hydrolases superfamily protein [Artemisia annua]|uniref:Alpha/beta-Hydrolases superfamily protein n=1 Tax=Artemisia annua TaxID=35608 RepID=A0A2U1NKR4_ARTAN|nr:alpha/beta-Hydrolases superfamily protein [Artemisia annua]